MAHDLNLYRSKFSGGKRIPPAKIIAWIENNFDYKTRKDGEEYCINSPFNADSGFNFNINPDKCSCHDWRGDEWAGPLNPETGKRNCSFVKFVKLYRKCSWPDAYREILGAKEDIKAYLRPEGRNSEATPLRKVAVALPSGTERLFGAAFTDPQAAIVTNWLLDRGYTEEDIDKDDLYYLGVEVYWPYYEFDTLVYWQSRNRMNKVFRFPDIKVYEDGKAVGETDGSKGDFLYGFDDCELASYVTITEAIFGKHTLGEQALASGGAILTPAQVNKIKLLAPFKGVILAPDNDKAGINSIITNYKLLQPLGFPMYYSIPPRIEYMKGDSKKYTKDWNEFVQELRMSRQDVRDLHDKRLKQLTAKTLVRLYDLIPKT